MPDFIFSTPTQTLAVYFSLVSVAAMLLGLIFIKPILRLLIGSGPDFNQTLNYTTSGFSLFYGLLLGLLTVAAYQNNQNVQQGIMNEASSLGTLYSDMTNYPEPIRTDMKTMLRDFVLFTIHKDWPAHRDGKFLNGGFDRTDAMRQKLASFEPKTKGQEIMHTEVVSSFQRFDDARQQRLAGVILKLPNVLWYAVLVGAVTNILLIVLLKMPLLQQFVLGSINAFFLGVILLVIVVLDRPLRGDAGLTPDPLQIVWDRQMVWDDPLR
jgi:hypothetical protein